MKYDEEFYARKRQRILRMIAAVAKGDSLDVVAKNAGVSRSNIGTHLRRGIRGFMHSAARDGLVAKDFSQHVDEAPVSFIRNNPDLWGVIAERYLEDPSGGYPPVNSQQ
jgi:hypothetical protein